MTANFKQFWHLWGLAGKVPVLWMKNLMCDWECGTLVTDALFSIPVKMGPIGCLENMSLGTNREPAVVYSLTIKTPESFISCQMLCRSCCNQYELQIHANWENWMFSWDSCSWLVWSQIQWCRTGSISACALTLHLPHHFLPCSASSEKIASNTKPKVKIKGRGI